MISFLMYTCKYDITGISLVPRPIRKIRMGLGTRLNRNRIRVFRMERQLGVRCSTNHLVCMIFTPPPQLARFV